MVGNYQIRLHKNYNTDNDYDLRAGMVYVMV